MEIIEHVSAMEGDLNSVKDAVDERLSAVEGSLTGLRTKLQEEFLEKQERLRKELCHELLRDLIASTDLLEGGLSPTAPFHLFLKPCWRTILCSQLVEGPVTQQWLAPFDGN